MKRIWREYEHEYLFQYSRQNIHTVGLTSGYFEVLHRGHLELFRDCKHFCDFLIVVVNGRNASKIKYGREITPLEDKIEIISEFRCIDAVIDYDDINMCRALKELSPDRFLKGGDRRLSDGSICVEEINTCKDINCEILDGVGGYDKRGSSSQIIKQTRSFSEFNNYLEKFGV